MASSLRWAMAVGLSVDSASDRIFVSLPNGELYRDRMDGPDTTVIGKFAGLSGIARQWNASSATMETSNE